MNNPREKYPHEAELFDKYPRIYDKVMNTINLLQWFLGLTLIGWIGGIITLLIIALQ